MPNDIHNKPCNPRHILHTHTYWYQHFYVLFLYLLVYFISVIIQWLSAAYISGPSHKGCAQQEIHHRRVWRCQHCDSLPWKRFIQATALMETSEGRVTDLFMIRYLKITVTNACLWKWKFSVLQTRIMTMNLPSSLCSCLYSL